MRPAMVKTTLIEVKIIILKKLSSHCFCLIMRMIINLDEGALHSQTNTDPDVYFYGSRLPKSQVLLRFWDLLLFCYRACQLFMVAQCRPRQCCRLLRPCHRWSTAPDRGDLERQWPRVKDKVESGDRR